MLDHFNTGRKILFKIHQSILIKVPKKLEIEGSYLSLIKVLYRKPIANIILDGENLKAFPLKSGFKHHKSK
jgi:hypothetical protein